MRQKGGHLAYYLIDQSAPHRHDYQEPASLLCHTLSLSRHQVHALNVLTRFRDMTLPSFEGASFTPCRFQVHKGGERKGHHLKLLIGNHSVTVLVAIEDCLVHNLLELDISQIVPNQMTLSAITWTRTDTAQERTHRE